MSAPSPRGPLLTWATTFRVGCPFVAAAAVLYTCAVPMMVAIVLSVHHEVSIPGLRQVLAILLAILTLFWVCEQGMGDGTFSSPSPSP